jgi:probable HAF family extracellular repeat protein
MTSPILRRLSIVLLATISSPVVGEAMAAGPVPSMLHYEMGVGTYTSINAMSGDASVSVGYTSAALGVYASSWSNAGVIHDLGLTIDNYANGVSYDGTTIVGYDDGGAVKAAWAYRNGSRYMLPTLGVGNAQANSASADGSIVVGWSSGASNEAMMWSGPNWSTVQGLGSLYAGGSSYAYDVDGTGTTVVGEAYPSFGAYYPHAFFWRDGVMHDLDSTSDHSSATAISNSGSTIVGQSSDGVGMPHAVSYTGWNFGTITDLGTLGMTSVATDVTADGSIIVGSSAMVGGGSHAFRYADGVMADLNTLMTDAGYNLGGVVLEEADAISANGDYIAVQADHSDTYLVYYHAGVAGLTTGAEQQASVDNLGKTRQALAIQQYAYAGILTGDLDRHDQSADIGAFGLVGSAVGGISGSAGLGHGFSFSAGVLSGTSTFGGASIGNGPMAAAALRYDSNADLGGFTPFAQVGGSLGLLNAVSFTRNYTGGTGIGETDGSLAALYGRIGLTKDFTSGDQVILSAELGNRWLATNAYNEELSPTNPFPLAVSAGTDRTSVGVLAAAWTHPFSDSVDLTLRAGLGAVLDQSSTIQTSAIGFGTLTPAGQRSVWAEAGAHLDWKVTAQSSIDLYATAMSGSGIGTNAHVGAGYRFRF